MGMRASKRLVIALAFTIAGLTYFVARGSVGFGGDSTAESPDFEEQLRAEIRGVDRDDNGIRDDVEAWVVSRFPQGTSGRQRLLQLAGAYQDVLLSTANAAQSMKDLRSLSEVLTCVRHVAGPSAEEEIVRLKAVVLNSDVRVRAWLKAYDRWETSGGQAEATLLKPGCSPSP